MPMLKRYVHSTKLQLKFSDQKLRLSALRGGRAAGGGFLRAMRYFLLHTLSTGLTPSTRTTGQAHSEQALAKVARLLQELASRGAKKSARAFRRSTPTRTIKDLRCSHHKGENLSMFCLVCKTAVCCLCLQVRLHRF